MYDWPLRFNPAHADRPAEGSGQGAGRRMFLVVVDDSPEAEAAVRFAAARARNTDGGVILLAVTAVPEFQHWMFVGSLMKEEHRLQTEERLSHFATVVRSLTGEPPLTILREGDLREELLRVLEDDHRISVLVLAASAESDGPGPLVSTLTGKQAHRLRVPLTIVPGALAPAQIEALA